MKVNHKNYLVMKRIIISILSIVTTLASAMAQTENPRGVYKLASLIDKNGKEIDAPFDQYKICTDSITLMMSVQGNAFRLSRNDSSIFNYTGEEPDDADSTKTRIFNSSKDHFSLKWWSTTPGHVYFPANGWCQENYVANSYSEKGKIVFDALMNPAATEVDKNAPIYGSWHIVETFDDFIDVKKYVKELNKSGKNIDDSTVKPNDILVISSEHMVSIGGRVYDFFSDGKTYFHNVKNTPEEEWHKITWLTPDLIAVSVTRNNGRFTDYELWHRIKSDITPISKIAHNYLSVITPSRLSF